jgi:hypothetical protein
VTACRGGVRVLGFGCVRVLGCWPTQVSLPHNVTAHFSHFPPLHAPLPRPHYAHSDQQGSHALANCANRRKGLGKRRNNLVAARGCHPPPTTRCAPVAFLRLTTNYFPKRPSVSFINLPDPGGKSLTRHFRTREKVVSTPRLGCEQAWVGVDGVGAAQNLPSMITRSRLSCAREPDPPCTPTHLV